MRKGIGVGATNAAIATLTAVLSIVVLVASVTRAQ